MHVMRGRGHVHVMFCLCNVCACGCWRACAAVRVRCSALVRAAVSCLAGACVSVTGFYAQKLYSATAWTIQANLNKIPTMVTDSLTDIPTD